MEPEPGSLHERLRIVAGQRSYRSIGEITNQNTETVRRYMLGAAPSIEFVSAMCDRFGVSAEWMLTGRGPMREKDGRRHALSTSSPSDLLAAVAGALEKLTDRVDRIETYVQTLETRLRAAGGAGGTPEIVTFTPPTTDATAAPTDSADEPGTASDTVPPGPGPYPAPDVEPGYRALWIANAVPQRPRTNPG
ncbi:MAG: hypothetical protein ACKVZJ_11505 [Phycisphaerales bacterium]